MKIDKFERFTQSQQMLMCLHNPNAGYAQILQTRMLHCALEIDIDIIESELRALSCHAWLPQAGSPSQP